MKKLFENVAKCIGGMDTRILKKYSDEMKDIHESYSNYMKSIDRAMLELHINNGSFTETDIREQRTMAGSVHDTIIYKIDEVTKDIQTARKQMNENSVSILCTPKELVNVNRQLDIFDGELLRLRAETDAELFRFYAYSELLLNELGHADEYAAFIYDTECFTWHQSIRYATPEETDNTSSKTEKSNDASVEEFKEA